MRTFTCVDCGVEAEAGARGPLPSRCHTCWLASESTRATAYRRRNGRLERGSTEHRAMRSRTQARVWRDRRNRSARRTAAA
jgi:hypothetical protein